MLGELGGDGSPVMRLANTIPCLLLLVKLEGGGIDGGFRNSGFPSLVGSVAIFSSLVDSAAKMK
jgi:hypothetical protein